MVGVRDSGLMNMENESLSPAVKKVSRIKRAFSNAPSVLALTIPSDPGLAFHFCALTST